MKIKKNKKGGDELKKVKETTNQKKSAVSKKDSDLQSKNLDDFLQDWSGNEDNDSEAAEEEQSENSDEDSGSDDEDVASASKQKQYLASLKAKDPEFHKFLEENDQELLNFDESSSDEDGDENDGLDPVHKLPDNLEVASDDSDFDDDDTDQKEGESKVAARPKVTNKMIENWSEKLEKTPSIQMISEVVMAFKAALTNISGEEVQEKGDKKTNKKKNSAAQFKIENGPTFNALIKLLIEKLEPALCKLLKGAKKLSDVQKAKNWRPLNKWLKRYTGDLCKFLGAVSEASVISALLKHIHGLVLYFAALPKSAKFLSKQLIHLWSTHEEESVRVLALMAIVRLVRTTLGSEHGSLLEMVIKQMYMAYIRNAKFTSPNTWPMIHFMRRSMVEVFLLNPTLAYKHAFIYIRQLTIHLRNAMINTTGSSSSGSGNKDQKKKENPLQTVYNWQFVHSIHLWIQLLSDNQSPVLEPLVYPLVQLINGTIRLNYTSKYYPLRFHLTSLLIQLSNETGKFIPTLPYYLDILNGQNFAKKGQKVSMKPMDFSCVLRLSKSQMNENGFKDSTIEHVYGGLLESLAFSSHKICFPELAVPALAQLRGFLKKSKIPNYTKKMKTVKEKTEENARFVSEKRSKVTFGVRDLDQIATFEAQLKAQGTPLSKYFEIYKGIKETEKAKKLKKEMDDYKHIPEVKAKKAGKTTSEFKGIFGDEDMDEDENDDDMERFELREDRGKKRAKPDTETWMDDGKTDEPIAKKQAKDDSEDSDGEEDNDEEEEADVVKEFDFDD